MNGRDFLGVSTSVTLLLLRVVRNNDWLTIDEAITFGRQYDIHLNLNLHRIPGYCVNDRELESSLLFDGTPDSMQYAREAVVFHWKLLARRYQRVPATPLSFDPLNVPSPAAGLLTLTYP